MMQLCDMNSLMLMHDVNFSITQVQFHQTIFKKIRPFSVASFHKVSAINITVNVRVSSFQNSEFIYFTILSFQKYTLSDITFKPYPKCF